MRLQICGRRPREGERLPLLRRHVHPARSGRSQRKAGGHPADGAAILRHIRSGVRIPHVQAAVALINVLELSFTQPNIHQHTCSIKR